MLDFFPTSQDDIDALLKGVTGETDELDIDISEDDWAAAMAAQVELDKSKRSDELSLTEWINLKIFTLRKDVDRHYAIADSCLRQVELLEEVRSRMKGD